MRAVVLPRPGSADVLEFHELETPTPADGEVLIRVRAAAVTRGDVALRRIPRLMSSSRWTAGPDDVRWTSPDSQLQLQLGPRR
jgi:NADPH:quinone reductase-like Zn-dependent oxidoreductase